MELALVAVAELMGHFGCTAPFGQQRFGSLDPEMRQPLVRRHADVLAERSDQPELIDARRIGDVVDSKRVGLAFSHVLLCALDRPRRLAPVTRSATGRSESNQRHQAFVDRFFLHRDCDSRREQRAKHVANVLGFWCLRRDLTDVQRIRPANSAHFARSFHVLGIERRDSIRHRTFDAAIVVHVARLTDDD